LRAQKRRSQKRDDNGAADEAAYSHGEGFSFAQCDNATCCFSGVHEMGQWGRLNLQASRPKLVSAHNDPQMNQISHQCALYSLEYPVRSLVIAKLPF
jgi:hypothetical protein